MVQAIDSAPSNCITIDCSKLRFIDSSGIAALVSARNHARKVGKVVQIVNPRDQALMVLRVCGLSEIFLQSEG
jgi:anti-anti-sigma factor